MFLFSSSFIIIWVFIECSTLGFLAVTCLLNKNQKFRSISSYFLIQALGSSLFIVSLILLRTPSSSFFILMVSLIYNISLTIKIGLFPFHFWVINLVPKLNWIRIFLLASVQKFIPMLILNWWLIDFYISLVVCVTILIRLYNSLGLIRVKLIFSYSILSHRAWIRLILEHLEWWSFYYLRYCILFFLICLFNNIYIFEDQRDCILLNNLPLSLLFAYIFNLISIIGIPPFLGFVIKWVILDSLFQGGSYFILFILVLTSVVHLYVYTRVMVWRLFYFSSKSSLFKNNCLRRSFLNFNYIIFTLFLNRCILLLVSIN